MRYTFRMFRLLAIVLAIFAGWSLAGCTAWATYPPVHGAAGMNNPGLAPVPELMGRAIVDTHERSEDPYAIVYNLPERIDPAVYRRVEKFLPEGSAPQVADDQVAIHVASIRIRGTEAEVDVIHLVDEVYQMTTVGFKQRITGWDIDSRRSWRIRVAAPYPNYGDTIEPESVTVDASDTGAMHEDG